MSATAAEKRPWTQAKIDAQAFYNLFPKTCFSRWTAAGSLRRRRPDVGDVDHVVIPAFGDVAVTGGLFEMTERVNLLWHHLDAMLEGGTVGKALVGVSGGYRWGEQQRAVLFRGFVHEIYTAEVDNWGGQLAVRTGPAEMSRRLVLGLQYNGYMSDGGFHVARKDDCRCTACHWQGHELDWRPIAEARANWVGTKWTRAPGEENEAAARCPMCLDPMHLEMTRVPCPEEEEYFRLAGIPWIEPEKRG
jgi:hypothetical protein